MAESKALRVDEHQSVLLGWAQIVKTSLARTSCLKNTQITGSIQSSEEKQFT
jgi:hypothetical protein